MELIKEIQLDSKEVEEAITEYLKNEGFKTVSFKSKSTNVWGLPYPISASIVVEDFD
ncbi:hypothetical protein KEH51_27505 [[Brevibacterium] frigoritolerans]|uniref:Uncharacterized protein n=1 Tax=Peribacillus frigoritolerans TaxID=450367 RepID=A0A941J3Q6_9BACI|nr:hypothetical protein [Peribacillus frigoritolerans]